MSKQQATRQQQAIYANYNETFDQAINRLLGELTNTGGAMGATTTNALGTTNQVQQQQPIKNINDPSHLQQVCGGVDVNDPQHLQQACAQFGVNPQDPAHSQQVQTIKQNISTYSKKQPPTGVQQQQKLTQPINSGAKAPVSAPPNVNSPVTQPSQQI